jgi:hypothetical protein
MTPSARAAPRPAADRPPLAPLPFSRLLIRHPARAAAILAAMRPAMYRSQAAAHAALTNVSLVSVAQEWATLLRCARPYIPTRREDRQGGQAAGDYPPARSAGELGAEPRAASWPAPAACGLDVRALSSMRVRRTRRLVRDRTRIL